MEIPCERIGPYRLTKWIGSGGIGRVFAAVHEHMEQEVALKILSPESAADPQLVARFLQEARALTEIKHPNVVRALHCDKLEDGTAFLAMEYLDGVTLRHWMKSQENRVPLEAALFVAREVADAMVEAHSRGIIHRDLKPENIMLVASDYSPIGYRIKVLDFGIAKVPSCTSPEQVNTRVQTGAPAFLGTATYMAPEQCVNVAKVTTQADTYSLGVMLFELLAGRPPFESSEPVALMAMHLRSPPPHLDEVARHVSPGLGAFIASMLDKEPSARPTMLRCRDMLERSWTDEDHMCPFPGLSPFTEEQAELFFGRQEEVTTLEAMLHGLATSELRWLQLEGPSGSGKTSLVQAGILPRLRSPVAGQPAWRISVVRPTADPIASLATALASASGHGATDGSQPDRPDIEAALRTCDEAPAARPPGAVPDGTLLLLVIDPFEELFTLGAQHLEQIDAMLANALTEPMSPLRLLTIIRSDHVHRLGQLPRFSSLDGRRRRYYLRSMDEGGLLQVIRGMISRSGLRLSEGLPERIARDALETDNRLPLLGHMLRSLWSPHPGLLLTHEHYERIGGTGGALLHQANAVLDGLSETGRERARWLLLDLVQVGRGAPDTMRSRTRAEIFAAAGGDQLAEDVMARLSGGSTMTRGSLDPTLSLLVFSGERGTAPAEHRVELVHDTLLRQVPTIASWVDRERDLLERQADLEATASAWNQAGCPLEGLTTGSLLSHYTGIDVEARRRGRLKSMASGQARRFLRSAQDLQRRRSRLRRAVIAVLVISGAAILVSAVYARRQQKRAEANLQSVILATKQVVSETDWQLGRVLYTLKARQTLLQQLDQILDSLPEADQDERDVIVAVAETKHRRSDLARLNESLARAEGFIAAARSRIDRGLQLDGSDHTLLELSALNHSKRGKIALARGRREEARAAFAESVALLTRLGGNDEDYRRTLATSYDEQAEAELMLGRAADAGKLADSAVELLGRNDSDYDRSQLALALRLRGVVARDGGDAGLATVLLERAQTIAESLADRSPGNAYFQWVLATVRTELAAVRRSAGRFTDADALSQWSRECAEELHHGDPTQKDYALLLCQLWLDLAEAASARGDPAEAKRARAHACEISAPFRREDPEDGRFQRFSCS